VHQQFDSEKHLPIGSKQNPAADFAAGFCSVRQLMTQKKIRLLSILETETALKALMYYSCLCGRRRRLTSSIIF
jgi:predicted lipase